MSAVVIPDLYRHTARKSTVSKNIKSSNVSPCTLNESPSPTTTTTNYSMYPSTSNSDEETIFNALQCDIKIEEDLSPVDQPFLLIRDNETEEMSIGEECEQQTDEQIIHQMIDEIVQSVPETSLSTSEQVNNSFFQD